LTNEQFDRLDKQAKETVLAAVQFAENSPQPPLDTLYDYTYANGIEVPAVTAKSDESAVETVRILEDKR
jgi:TPP-dependent pyruvate/acetoin dehydrogenase alpha subunit